MLAQSSIKLWDLEKPIITERSRLHHLKPIGVGTAMLESLTGYIARLADSHSVFPGILISREIAPLIEKNYIKESANMGLRALFNRASALNSSGTMAFEVVQALETLTLQKNLRLLTLLNWVETLLVRGLFRDVKAWCPACYQEWHLSVKVIYEPLLWTINPVMVCLQHHQLLGDSCPQCQQKQPILAWRSQPGYCSSCGGWLGISSNNTSYTEHCNSKTLSEKELQREIWVAKVIGELIANNPYLGSPPSKKNIARSLGRAIEIVTDGNIAAFARLVGLPKNTVWMWQRGKTLPQLDMLLRICHFLEITLLDFLTLEDISSAIKTIKNPCQQRSQTPRTSPKYFKLEQVQNALLLVLASDQMPPPAMKEVAQRLGYDRRTISQHFPQLCRDISAKYLSYRKALRLENIELSCKEVRQIAAKLCNEGIYPTENLISESMTKPGYLRYKKVRATLQQAQVNFPR